jgi:hypothetical protein
VAYGPCRRGAGATRPVAPVDVVARSVARLPSTGWYRAAGLVLAAGVALALAWFLHVLVVHTHAVNTFVDVPWATGATVEVAQAGDHTVWTGPACNGACRPEPAATYRRHLDLGFIGPDGQAVPVTAAPEQYFNVGSGREGRAAWLVRFDRPGRHQVRLATDGEVTRPRLWLGEGRGLPVRFARGSLFLLGGAAAVAGLLVVGTRLRRRRAVSRMGPVVVP